MQSQLRGDGSNLPVLGKIEMADLYDDIGSNHASLPAYERGDEPSHAATDDADDSAEALAPYGFRLIMQFLRPWCFRYDFHQRPADTARTTIDDGRLICHADRAQLLAILAHPVAVISPDLRILLITAVGFLPLLLPTLLPTLFTAVRLSPIARSTDKKHDTAVGCTAKQLSKRNFALHRPTGAEWTMAAARGKLTFTCLVGRLFTESP
jgi:hypothetical protein